MYLCMWLIRSGKGVRREGGGERGGEGGEGGVEGGASILRLF